MKQPSILIAGSYGHGNTGDEAILVAMLSQLRARQPDATLRVVAGDVAAIPAGYGADALYWASWAEIADAVKQADLVILGGGGLFFDYGDFEPRTLLENGAPDLSHFGSFPLLAGLFGKPLMLYACGVGPLITPAGREMARVAFSLAHRATVRDGESKALLEAIAVDGSRVEVTADPAFSLQAVDAERARAILAEHQLRVDRPLIGLALRPWDFGVSPTTWEARVAEAVAHFAAKEAAQILLIPFHKGFDDPVLIRMSERLQISDVRLLTGGYSPAEMAGLIGQCDLLVGLRLHSILFAVLTGTPAVALAYDPKVRSLARLVGHEEICVDLTDLADLERLLASAWERRGELGRDFLRASAALKPQAEKNADLACDLLDQDVPDLASSNAAFRRLLAQVTDARLARLRAGGDERQNADAVWRAEVQRLYAQVVERDQTIRELQAELHTKIGEANQIIRDLQADHRTRG